MELIVSYAYNEDRLQKKFLIGEGYVGTCFKERNVIEIDNLESSYTSIKSGLGEEFPKFLVLVPLKMDETILGVIELASFKKLKGYKVSFIQKMAETLTSIISTEITAEKMLKVFETSKMQEEVLSSQEEELRQQLEEMTAAQEETARHENELVKQAEEFATNEIMYKNKIESLHKENAELKKTIDKIKLKVKN